MKRNSGTIWMVAVLLLCVAAGSTDAITVAFQEGVNGYVGTADTYLDNDSGTPGYNTANYGGFGWMRVGNLTGGMEQAGLVRFDNIMGSGPSQIPAGATIESATLRMTAFAVKNHPGWTGNFHYAVPMITSWVEGSVPRETSYPHYAEKEEGASCGDYRHYRADGNYGPGDHWGTSGSPNTNGPVSGQDNDWSMYSVERDALAAGTFPTVGGAYDPDAYPISDNYWAALYGTRDVDYDVTAVLQAVQAGTMDNEGWLLTTHYEHDHLYYFTSEYGDPGVQPLTPPAGYLGYRPELIVEYVPEPATMGLLLLGVPWLIKRRRA